jgi:hypothetical protein
MRASGLRIFLTAFALASLASSAGGKAAEPAVDPASLSGHLIFIGQTSLVSRPDPNPGAYQRVSRIFGLDLSKHAGTPVPLTPVNAAKAPGDPDIVHLVWDAGTQQMYYEAINDRGPKDPTAWYVLKSLDSVNDLGSPQTFDPPDIYENFSFSRAGRYTAGVRKMSGGYLTITDLTGATPPVKITGQAANPWFQTAWSPDDSKVVFVGELGGDLNFNELFIADRDGANIRQLTDLPQWVSWWVRLWAMPRKNERWDLHKSNQPSWSPDGQWILFSSFKGVYRVHPDGSMLQLIAERAWSPTWSPDGKTIAYVATRDGGGFSDDQPQMDIYVSNPDGTGETRITDNRSTIVYSDLRWLPLGKP